MFSQLFSLNRDQRLMFFAAVFWGFGVSMFLFLQPLYVASLGATPRQVGVALGLGAALVTGLYVPFGMWADRWGRKPIIVSGWALGALATFFLAAAPDWRWVIPTMGLYMLSNFAMPAFNGYIAASDQSANLSRTMAILASGSSLASIVAPAVGGWLGEAFGLRAVYFFAACLFGISTVFLTFLTPQPVEPRRADEGAGKLVSDRWFVSQVLFTLALFFAIDVGMVLAPTFLEEVRGWTVGQIGWLGTAGSVGVVVLSLALGNMRTDRPVSLFLAQAAVLLAVLLIWVTPAPALIILAYFIHGNNRVVRPIVIGRLAHRLNRSTLSLGYGFYETAMRLGLAASPFVAGLLYEREPHLPLLAGAVAVTLCLVWTLGMAGPGRREPVSAAPSSQAAVRQAEQAGPG
jgi:MFS family permease